MIGRRQLLVLGYSRQQVQRARGRTLFPVPGLTGVYSVGHRRLSQRGRWMAAVLACGPDSAVSHRTGLAAGGLFRSAPGPIDVTVPGRKSRHRPGLRIHNVRSLDPQDVVMIGCLPVTSIARTMLDIAATEPPRWLGYALEAAQRRPDFDLGAIYDVIERSHGARGVPALRAAVADLSEEAPLSRSQRERLLLSALRDSGLPEPSLNVSVEGETVDFCWPQQRVILEFDSWQFHKTRSRFEADRRRDSKLNAAGWRVVRVTDRRLRHDRAALIAELSAVLRLAAAA